MIVCQIGTMGSIEKEGMISQHIFNECKGYHIYCDLYSELPKADIYILNSFKNPKHLEKEINFKTPGKLISLVHSSEPCMPSKYSDKVVTITNAWQSRLKTLYNIDSEMIYGAIDSDLYKDAKINYSNTIYGRISRYDKGKFHNNFEDLCKKLKFNYSFEHRLISKKYPETDLFDVVRDIKINNHAGKVNELSKLSVYADAHSTRIPFIETFNMGLLEAMACGLPCIIIGSSQEAMCEVLGDAGIICKTIHDFEFELVKLLSDPDKKQELGMKAKERAQFFSKDKMINSWNKLLEELC